MEVMQTLMWVSWYWKKSYDKIRIKNEKFQKSYLDSDLIFFIRKANPPIIRCNSDTLNNKLILKHIIFYKKKKIKEGNILRLSQ